ncbi:MAG TPA: MFS transporter [Segeticoccus sp.]|uniref:MFS transporter n=1 Tax=Segeticoccus sp. TaxID=2706531 RepID=UPI002D81033A|nr:MFS transporter [Segeticoccus sp.]HET8601985.1 MFS transporter [Segeticoccus sp.]
MGASHTEPAPGAIPKDGEVPNSLLRRAVGAAAIGNATEWYDYGVYAYVATEIGKNFFPGEYSTLGTLLVFAVSFVLRPLGGVFWGPLGDRLGRNRVMAMTIILMSLGTFLIGVIPSYDSIGVWAPILLVVLRVVQGFSTGGEYGGAATFMAEYAPDKKRGFWGSFLEFGTLAGFTLGLVITLVLRASISAGAMDSWGWRIPFLLGLPLGLIGLYLRSRMEDTPVFRELQEKEEVESGSGAALKDLFKQYWRPIMRLFGLVIALNVANYTLLAYMPTYLQDQVGMSAKASETLLIISQLIMMAMIWMAGALSDRIGRKNCWWISLGGLFVLATPCFWLIQQGFVWGVIGFTIMGLIYLLQLGTISATFPAMFPTHVRYAGMAIGYNVATAAFGGTAAPVNEALVKATGNDLMPAFYMMAAMVVGMIALVKVPETVGRSIRGRHVPGTHAEEEKRFTLPDAQPVEG